MNKHIRNSLVFTGGAVVGFTICGVLYTKKLLSSKTVTNAIIDKWVGDIFEESKEKNIKNHGVVWNPKSVYAPKDKGTIYKPDLFQFTSSEDANEFRDSMLQIANDYGFCSVADANDLAGITSDYITHKYGWKLDVLKDISIIYDYKTERWTIDLGDCIEIK